MVVGMNAPRQVSGAKIRAARLSAGMTQAALARAAQVSERNVVRWENDQHTPRMEHIEAIARATNREVSFFFQGEEDDEESELPTAREDAFLEALRPFARMLLEERA